MPPAYLLVLCIANFYSQSALFGSWFSCKLNNPILISLFKRMLTSGRRPACYLLAGYEQGTVVVDTEKDLPHDRQLRDSRNRLRYCKFLDKLFYFTWSMVY